MKALIHAELLKLRTTRAFWLMIAAALAFVPVTVALGVTGASEGSPALDTAAGVRNVFSAASSGGLLVLVVGIMLMAGEFRHTTITSTFLVSPDRERVVLAKLAAGGLVGIALAAAGSLVTAAVAVPWLEARGVGLGAYVGDIAGVLAGSFAATALYALVGVGFGALVRNQTAAVTAALVWMTAVEALLVGFLPEVGRWLPGGASSALSGVSTLEGGLLPAWAAALLFAGYGLAFAAAGTRLLARRDIA